MSTISSDRAKSIAAARSTPNPDRRSARPNPTARPNCFRPSTWRVAPVPVPVILCWPWSAGCRRLRQQLAHPGAADVPDVLLVLEDDTERFVDHLRAELGRAERQQGRRPVEGLG